MTTLVTLNVSRAQIEEDLRAGKSVEQIAAPSYAGRGDFPAGRVVGRLRRCLALRLAELLLESSDLGCPPHGMLPKRVVDAYRAAAGDVG